MHTLGRSPAPMGELLFRITGAQGSHTIGILMSHPLAWGVMTGTIHNDTNALC
jgi:hypothetical protein